MPRTVGRKGEIDIVRQAEYPDRHGHPTLRAARPHPHGELPDKIHVHGVSGKLDLRIKRGAIQKGHPQEALGREVELLAVRPILHQTAKRIQGIVGVDFQQPDIAGNRSVEADTDLRIRHRNRSQPGGQEIRSSHDEKNGRHANYNFESPCTHHGFPLPKIRMKSIRCRDFTLEELKSM